MSSKRKLAVAVLIAAGVGFLFWLVDEVPPRSITELRMLTARRALTEYWKNNGELPSTLSKVSLNETKDAWGRELVYERMDSTTGRFTSLGEDGNLGGSGDNRDMIATFRAGDDQWKQDPLIDN